jgi:hypothetical protein
VPEAGPPVNNGAETVPPDPSLSLFFKRFIYDPATLADQSGTVMYNMLVRHRNSVNKIRFGTRNSTFQLFNKLRNSLKPFIVQRVPAPLPIYFLVFWPAYIATGSGFFNPLCRYSSPSPLSPWIVKLLCFQRPFKNSNVCKI